MAPKLFLLILAVTSLFSQPSKANSSLPANSGNASDTCVSTVADLKTFVPTVTSLARFPTYIDFVKKWDNFGEETTMWDNLKNNRGFLLPKPMDPNKSPSFDFKESAGQISVSIDEIDSESKDRVAKDYSPVQFCRDPKGKYYVKGKDLKIDINRDPMGFSLTYKGKKYFTDAKNPTRPSPSQQKTQSGGGRS